MSESFQNGLHEALEYVILGATLSRLVRSLARGRLSDKLLSRDHVRSPAGVSHEAQAMSHPSHERALRQEVWTCPGRSSQNHACRVSKHLEMHRLPSEALSVVCITQAPCALLLTPSVLHSSPTLEKAPMCFETSSNRLLHIHTKRIYSRRRGGRSESTRTELSSSSRSMRSPTRRAFDQE